MYSNTIRHFSKFSKSLEYPTEKEIEKFKTKLLSSCWNLKDDVISTYPAKQLYITLQSVLDKSSPPFMELLNINGNYKVKSENINNRFKIGDIVPTGYSLAYCNPLSNENELSSDGYDNYHAPTTDNKEFFKRRMWVSGSFDFKEGNPLRFGDSLNFTETVNRIKVLPRNGVIFADYKRCFNNSIGNSIIEYRRLCYLNDMFQKSTKTNMDCPPQPDNSISINPSIITSFRMSALTFNSHQIHYNSEYSKNVEKYTDVVIEAPLLISLALQFYKISEPDSHVSSFKYKISAPCFINDEITINYKSYSDFVRLWISKDSRVCFDSTIQI